MIANIRNMLRDEPIASVTLAVALGGTATILGAWFFQYALNYQPCALCLEERIPYYIAIPLGVVIAAAALQRLPRKLLVIGLALVVLVMLWSAGLGIYHAGIEWKLWAGPPDCSGPLTDLGTAGDLLRRVQTSHIARCDDAAWRFLGISLAGYNALISLTLAAIAIAGALARDRSR